MLLKENYKRRNEKSWSLWLLPLAFLSCFVFSAQSFAMTTEKDAKTVQDKGVTPESRKVPSLGQYFANLFESLRDENFVIDKAEINDVIKILKAVNDPYLWKEWFSLKISNQYPELMKDFIGKKDNELFKLAIKSPYWLGKVNGGYNVRLIGYALSRGGHGPTLSYSLVNTIFLPGTGYVLSDEARRDEARRDEARRDEARRTASPVNKIHLPGTGYVLSDEARRDEARRDEARRDEARRDEARRDEARRDEARRTASPVNKIHLPGTGYVLSDEARRDEARRDEARRDEARRDEARRDEARRTASPVNKIHLPGTGYVLSDGSRSSVYWQGAGGRGQSYSFLEKKHGATTLEKNYHATTVPYWRSHFQIVNLFIESADQTTLRWIVDNTLRQPKGKHAEFIEAIIERGNQETLELVDRMLSEEADWKNHPRLLELTQGKEVNAENLKKALVEVNKNQTSCS